MASIRIISFATLALAVWLSVSLLGVTAAQAAGGCGLGFHRGPYGACRPNAYGAPGYYGYRGGAYGYRGGAYGYRGGARSGYRGGGVYRGGQMYRGGRVVAGRHVGGYRGGYRGGRGGGGFRR